MQRAMKTNIGGRGQDFSLRHAIHMSVSDGNIDRAIELTKLLSITGWSLIGGAEVTAFYDQMIPRLDSKEDTLKFLEEHLDQSISLGFSSPWATNIFWAAYYGDYDLAEKIMEKGIKLDEQLGILDATWFNYPIINPLRNTTTYKNLVRRINLDDFWRNNGFPVNCRPIGDDDFACN